MGFSEKRAIWSENIDLFGGDFEIRRKKTMIGTANSASQNERQNSVGGSTGSTNLVTDKVLTA